MRRKRIYGHRRVQRSPIKEVSTIERDEKDPSQDLSDTAKDMANIPKPKEQDALQKDTISYFSTNDGEQIGIEQQIQENIQNIEELKNKEDGI